jgi:pyrrolidone-carboxylate peptidase
MINNTILLTGFEKFDKFSSNLSGDIVRYFEDKFNQYPIEKIILPVSWKRSVEAYLDFFKSTKLKPYLVLLLGIHSKKTIYLEKYSLNWAFGKDVDGHYKMGFINIRKSLKFNTNLNLKEIYKALKSSLKLSISYYPGFFLCNYLYYWALDISKNEYPVIFIHIPRKGRLEDYLSYIKKIIEGIINYMLE